MNNAMNDFHSLYISSTGQQPRPPMGQAARIRCGAAEGLLMPMRE